MAVQVTIQIGDPKLKAENEAIEDFSSPELKSLVKDLADTMKANDLIGIAAPQIGVNKKVFITEPRSTGSREGDDSTDNQRVYINPFVTFTSPEEIIIYEGCGSVLNGQLFGPVARPRVFEVEAYDLEGKKFKMKADGILGRVIQHEYDHLIGVEFLEKVSDYRMLMTYEHYCEQKRNDSENVANSKITISEFSYLE